MAVGDTAKYRRSSSSGLDGLRSNGDARYAFNSSNAFWHSSVHSKALFRILKNGKHLSKLTRWIYWVLWLFRLGFVSLWCSSRGSSLGLLESYRGWVRHPVGIPWSQGTFSMIPRTHICWDLASFRRGEEFRMSLKDHLGDGPLFWSSLACHLRIPRRSVRFVERPSCLQGFNTLPPDSSIRIAWPCRKIGLGLWKTMSSLGQTP